MVTLQELLAPQVIESALVRIRKRHGRLGRALGIGGSSDDIHLVEKAQAKETICGLDFVNVPRWSSERQLVTCTACLDRIADLDIMDIARGETHEPERDDRSAAPGEPAAGDPVANHA